MKESTTSTELPEIDVLPWDACIAHTRKEADRQWEARRARQEGIRKRYQSEHPSSRLIRSSAMRPAWAA